MPNSVLAYLVPISLDSSARFNIVDDSFLLGIPGSRDFSLTSLFIHLVGCLSVFCWLFLLHQSFKCWKASKTNMPGEQDGGELAGYVVHLSSWIHHKYTSRHRSACRTPAERGQEYWIRGKEYIQPWKTQDQALSLWSGSTGSKTLDYQRTNPREYQIVGTQTKETTGIQDPTSPNHH